MATFKTITANDIQTTRSSLNQLVDVVQEDISGSSTRKKFQVFVTGGVGPGVTSSLFETVYDQDFTLQTANPVLDMTIGLFYTGSTVNGTTTGTDSSGKLLFPSESLMMREKIDNYKQFAQLLLGDSTGAFYSPGINTYNGDLSYTQLSTGSAGDRMEDALFLNFKRLFARDEIRKETFALRMYQTGALDGSINVSAFEKTITNGYTGSNVNQTSPSGSTIYADVGASTAQLKFFGGDVGYIKNTSNTSEFVGLMWYDQGIGVLDMGKVFWSEQHMSGVIGAMNNTAYDDAAAGYVIMGRSGSTGPATGESLLPATSANVSASFIPDFLVSGSIDDIVDHVATTRFSSGSLTASTFQNVTNINSTLIFCRATADEFNYSSNPTFTDAEGNLTVVDPGDDTGQRTFTFVSTVGLYNSNNELLAVAKLSRPVEKNDEKDLTVRVRLDF